MRVNNNGDEAFEMKASMRAECQECTRAHLRVTPGQVWFLFPGPRFHRRCRAYLQHMAPATKINRRLYSLFSPCIQIYAFSQ